MKTDNTTDLARLQTIVKVWQEYEDSTNERYGQIVLKTLNILLKLINSLHEQQVKLTLWEIWSEPIIFKFSYHVSSLIKLYSGTELPFEKDGKKILIFDEPSVFILFRTILENYLTFFYLFIDKISKDEKEFRMLVWRYCGLKQRIEFVINNEKEKEKQQKEVVTVQKLKDEILSNSHFVSYKPKLQKVILEGRNPRLFESWKSLITKSNFNTDLFQNIYGFKSNYSHSEFISVLQLHEGQYGHHSKNTRSHYLMFLLHGIIGKLIIDVKNYFPSINKLFESQDLNINCELNYLSELISNPIKS